MRSVKPQYLLRRRAMSMLYMLVVWVPLIGFAVLFGVDRGIVMLARSQLSAASDAASMAAASGLVISPAEARIRAKQIAAANLVNGSPLVLLDSDIEIGTWSSSAHTFTVLSVATESTGNAVRVNARLSDTRGTGLRLAFQGILTGKSTVDIQKSSIGQVAMSSANDLVLVQDVTGSFRDEISYARDGDLMLLQTLNANGGNTRFGIAAFTGTSNIVSPLTNVSSSYSSLSGLVSSLDIDGVNMPTSNSCTDISAGIEKGIEIFDTASTSGNTKSMLIVSDGECVSSPYGAHPTLTDVELLALANDFADAAWAKKINIYVVFWDSANNPDSAAKLSTLVRGEGKFMHVTDLSTLASTIGSQVIKSTYLVK